MQLLDWSFSHGAIFKGDRIIEVLEKLIGNRNIEDLPIRFTAVAADLEGEREVWLNSGPLFDAIRASIAIPLLFEPVKHLGKLLVDGGLINPIPIAPVLNEHSDLIVAVELNAPAEGHPLEQKQPEPASSSDSEYRLKISGFIERFLPADGRGEEDNYPGLFDLLIQSMDVMQTTIARYKLAGYTPDVTVNIPRDACKFFEFYRARELIDFGYSRAGEALSQLESVSKS